MLERVPRTVAYLVCGLGLAIFYLGMIVPVLVGESDVFPSAVLRAGVILTALGCVWLVVLLLAPTTRPARANREAIFGFVSLPAAMIALFGVMGETGVEVFWVVVTVVLLPASVALVFLAALVEKNSGSMRGGASTGSRPGSSGSRQRRGGRN